MSVRLLLTMLACVVCALTTSSFARADKLADAEELFRRAKSLMNASKHQEACPLLEESQKLDPQMGTLLNLAICHETIGKIATAWGEFRAVEQQARLANREDRVKLARARAAKLEPRLPRIKILAPEGERPSGLVVKIDGEEKGEPLWAGLVVDPGPHVVEASAPGKTSATLEVAVDEEGAVVPVTIPVLEDEKVEPPPSVVAQPEALTDPSVDYSANRRRRTTGIVVGGIGVAAMAVGGVFGVLAIVADSDAEKACPQPCYEGSSEARSADASTDRALVFANVANIALPVGLLAAAIGGYMALSAGPTEKPGPRAFVSPRRGGASFGITW